MTQKNENEEWLKEWRYNLCKGKLRSFVVKEKEPLKTIVKTTSTYLRSEFISEQRLSKILIEIEKESVEGFANSSDRKNRFDDLKKEINEFRK